MTRPLRLNPDRFFPAEPIQRQIAGELFASVSSLPIISPHGHTDPSWFSDDTPFEDAVSLFLWPDHYLLRMLMSQGLALESFGVQPLDGAPVETDRRTAWRRFAESYYLFRGTPSRLWLDHVFANVFSLKVRLDPETADHYFDVITEKLAQPEFRPRALFKRFNIEVLATTEGAVDPLESSCRHRGVRMEGPGDHDLPAR